MAPDPELILTTEHRVPTYEADAHGRMSPAALARLLQEVAARNAAGLGYGYEDLVANGHGWVLHGLLIRIERLPRFDERVTVTTWPRALNRLHALRDYRIAGTDGEPIGAASSAWFVMDLAKRRPVRPDRYKDRDWQPERALDRDPGPVPQIEAADREVRLPVRFADLDLNGHVNNSHYLDFAIETHDTDWLREREIREIEMTFLAEGRRGDVVVSRRQAAPDRADTVLYSLLREDDGKEIFRARAVWD